MTETQMWLHQVQQHVDTAQLVLDEVGRGLATVDRVEVATERAVPVLRIVTALAVGGAAGVALYLWVVRPARQRRRQPPEARREDRDDPVGQL